MAQASSFSKIRISLASPEQMRSWSSGEVKKPETINYRTFKPERDGLFCERIFGPVKDWECHCGRYKKVKFKGITCDRCGVEVTRSKVRRERMGHIELAAPVSHIWYLKGVPSPISLLLDISPRPLEKVIYFGSYIVTHVDKPRLLAELPDIEAAISSEIARIEHAGDAHVLPGLIDEPVLGVVEDEALEEVEEELEETVEAEDVVPEPAIEEEAVEAAAPVIEDEPIIPTDEVDEEADEELEEEDAELASAGSALDFGQQESRNAEERVTELSDALRLLQSIERRQLIAEDQWRGIERVLEIAGQRLGRNYHGMIRAGLGAAAIKELLQEIDLEELSRQLRMEVAQTQGPRRARAVKRLEVVEAFLKSKSRPEWMILDVITVIPPELRPMVQLDGGRFATSDLNDLYRRIINRNNRLKKITEIRAPESIINHEKRLLQEAVDALIDNGRRARPVVGSNNRPLRSLSDMLKGKEGRFRKNLLGKRVDYSGRSVIVVGPNLKLHQCGLPKEMALELFKPFVMKTLVEKNYTTSIKTAKRMMDRVKPEVWDALEEVIKEHPVLLNRAPTLHRLGIQAFEPILVEGKAIRLHPLVCVAFGADFDGDQMAVHVPLSATAQAEARLLMLSTRNVFAPSDGRPIVAPKQDIVLGCYYLTQINESAKGANLIFKDAGEALLAYESGLVDLHAPVKFGVVRKTEDGQKREYIRSTIGRLILNQILPERSDGDIPPEFVNKYPEEFQDVVVDSKEMSNLVSKWYEKHGWSAVVQLLDDLKNLGFAYVTRSGITISITDLDVPAARDQIIHDTERAVERANMQYRQGLISAGEREQRVLENWTNAYERVADAILENIDRFNPVYMITNSGARGSRRQITQLSGMRGLMSDPFGKLIEDLPIKSNFHEGLTVLEYFTSTHGQRKGLADTALRTADAGYLTRRLVDVAQDVIVREQDCGTFQGIYVSEIREGSEIVEELRDRIRGRTALETITHPATGETLVEAGEEISDEAAAAIQEAGITRVGIRSPMTCELRKGICAKCYGRDMGRHRPVEVGTAVGIIAAQSIGEPGTQLTMRTFHTGGIAGATITGVAGVKRRKQETLKELHEDARRGMISLGEGAERERNRAVQAMLKVLEEQVRGLLRVVELVEARRPKGQAIITEYDGVVAAIEDKRGLPEVVIHTEVDASQLEHYLGETLAEPVTIGQREVSEATGEVTKEPKVVFAAGSELTDKVVRGIRELEIPKVKIRKSYLVPYRGSRKEEGRYVSAGLVNLGQEVHAGDRLTEGPLDPQRVLELQGIRGVQDYLVREIQMVYKGQAQEINDKHIEVIVRQMLRKRKILDPGSTNLLPGQVVDRFEFEDENRKVLEMDPPGTPATAEPMLLGITEASLATDSFLSAASFQKTTKVLAEAAIRGKEDNLVGLKENVIIGRLIPAGTGLSFYRAQEAQRKASLLAGNGQSDDATARFIEAMHAVAHDGDEEEHADPLRGLQDEQPLGATGIAEPVSREEKEIAQALEFPEIRELLSGEPSEADDTTTGIDDVNPEAE
jgi:DNA-directed RNA polymerase subunit beta'